MRVLLPIVRPAFSGLARIVVDLANGGFVTAHWICHDELRRTVSFHRISQTPQRCPFVTLLKR